MRDSDRADTIRRFGTGRIVEHAAAVVLVGVLAATGLAQKFYTASAAQWLILRVGGIDNLRWIHRGTGMLFLVLTVVHVLAAVVGIGLRRWQPSMLITRNDFRDAVRALRYYVGLEDAPPEFDRYDVKQKFEYWGILVGSLLMILSGLVLWFPTDVTRFLPGEVVPAAKVLHSREATVIFLLIAVWHIYNAIFRPEVFPLDGSIFTGMISRERMRREHPLELARLEGRAGRAPEARAAEAVEALHGTSGPA